MAAAGGHAEIDSKDRLRLCDVIGRERSILALSSDILTQEIMNKKQEGAEEKKV